jgi:hypothetical protein
LEENVKLYDQERGDTGEENSAKFKDSENNLKVKSNTFGLKSDDLRFGDTLEDVVVSKTGDPPKDISKGKLDTLAVEKKACEGYTYKSEEPRFLDFPPKFEDWSEDQKKDAYDNNFKLYLTTSLRI